MRRSDDTLHQATGAAIAAYVSKCPPHQTELLGHPSLFIHCLHPHLIIMRSLTPTGHSVYSSETTGEGSKLSKIAVDPETGAVYVTSERQNDGVEVDILKFEALEDGTITSEVYAPHREASM